MRADMAGAHSNPWVNAGCSPGMAEADAAPIADPGEPLLRAARQRKCGGAASWWLIPPEMFVGGAESCGAPRKGQTHAIGREVDP